MNDAHTTNKINTQSPFTHYMVRRPEPKTRQEHDAESERLRAELEREGFQFEV